MIALALALLVLAPPTEDSVPTPDPTQPESPFELSMPGDTPSEAFGERPTDEETFTLLGTVVEIGPEIVRLRRRGEIDADLILTEDSSLFVDGEGVAFDEIPLGSEAEARFVLRGVDRVVIELHVTR